MNKQKMRGDSTAPCFTPLLRGMLAVVPWLFVDQNSEPRSMSAMMSTSAVTAAAAAGLGETRYYEPSPPPPFEFPEVARGTVFGASLAQDRRFDEGIMSRYTCDARDPYGEEPMIAFVSFQFGLSRRRVRFGAIFKFEGITLGRIIASLVFNPFEVFYDNPEDATTPLFSHVMPTFYSLFDVMQVEKATGSFNIVPWSTKMISGTVIPGGVSFDLKNIDFLGMFKLTQFTASVALLTLTPHLDVALFIDEVDIEIPVALFTTIKFQLGGVRPQRRQALQQVMVGRVQPLGLLLIKLPK